MEKILGVKINNLSRNEINSRIESFLNEEKFHQIATVNPEFVLTAQKNEKFREILNNCDLCVADGAGIFFAFLRFGKWLRCRITGIDLMQEILRVAEKKNLSIFLASWTGSLSTWQETRKAIQKKHPNLNISGNDFSDRENFSYQIPNTKCQILFCNFGAPNQEIFINSLKNDNIRLAMGVGGSFDYLTGKTPRAPKFVQILDIEWLWRLILEPKYRFKRIFRAIIIFPIRVILNR